MLYEFIICLLGQYSCCWLTAFCLYWWYLCCGWHSWRYLCVFFTSIELNVFQFLWFCRKWQRLYFWWEKITQACEFLLLMLKWIKFIIIFWLLDVYSFSNHSNLINLQNFGKSDDVTGPSMLSELPISEEVTCGGYHTCVITSIFWISPSESFYFLWIHFS